MSAHEVYYKAMASRDKRFDGKFYAGVKTTGIYCRPICPAPCPKRENVNFYATAASAREAGFRPCLRCHPESAPHSYDWEGSPALLSQALRLITEGFLDQKNIEDLAASLGISPR
ncbi:MAG: 3-methyladenine DNA glycosylase 2, partial [Anaerolineae bacterium]|nr:3-methyladenine DNA glycosylase 2 [Anaerolineae bacterium]